MVPEGLPAAAMNEVSPSVELREFLDGLRDLTQFMDLDAVGINTRGSTGDAPLKIAVVRQNFPVTAELLRLGADPNIPGEDDCTPLHHAVAGDASIDIVRLLLENDALPHLKDRHGHSSIDYARMNGRRDLLNLFGIE